MGVAAGEGGWGLDLGKGRRWVAGGRVGCGQEHLHIGVAHDVLAEARVDGGPRRVVGCSSPKQAEKPRTFDLWRENTNLLRKKLVFALKFESLSKHYYCGGYIICII